MKQLSMRGLRSCTAIAALITTAFVTFPALTLSASATTTWTLDQAPASPVTWSTVDFLNGQWIALSQTGDAATSSNGTAWTDQSAPVGSWQSVAYGAGRYVALSSADTASNEMTSTNGLQWSTLSGLPGTPAEAGRPSKDGQWTGITYGHGLFVAVSAVGTVDTSENGVTWTQRFWRPENSFTSITYGDGRFIAVDAAQGDILLSLNGVNWSLIYQPLTGAVPSPVGGLHLGAVAYGSGNFVAFGDSASGAGYVATSVSGYIWTLHQYSPAQEVDAVTYGCGSFVAGGQSTGASDPIITSPNGALWTESNVPTPAASSWTSISYGDGKYVAVDAEGDTAISKGVNCAATAPSAPLQVSGNVRNGEVWTYMHPSSSAGGAPVEGYRVAITDGVTTTYCRAALYFEPNCIIKGLQNHKTYWVTAQAYNRFGYSAPTDPEFVIPVAAWSLQVAAPPAASATSVPADTSAPSTGELQLTGVIANSEGFYPVTTVSIHFGSSLKTCRPNPFGECLITVTDPPTSAVPTYASYTGYGHSYRSPTQDIVFRSA
jgi:hypothetical protein